MVKKVESFTTYDGKVFLSEEAAVRHESLQRLCEIIPEFQMVRPRIEEQLDAVASAMGPMVAFRARVPSKPVVSGSLRPVSECPHYVVCPRPECDEAGYCQAAPAADHGELAGTCDCSAGMNGADDHAPTCPSYRPVAGLSLAHG
ncbi:MAG: hypothetical protein CMG88_03640 [Marinobacter sp.]|nr:hypothetical protein [Marinobacter sp.]MBP53637.1 hypothetical protein [Marinobacter sp.]|tara:strand:- start:535 stop:969 length:435 start_codon:yes stop_codon:yes gene_type:complete